ncbi:MAG TPA: hypothetical protein VL752_08500 [Acidisoma sp.]|uniref:hypothetical protein n=1 Tax=Acidisoma sp. TaxID=1872115 RepID=UPI002C5E4F46|nr:hypothetical protein [Acidisoma sp.]HTI00972.1 hypothetical protein [Acidisoma sp.]
MAKIAGDAARAEDEPDCTVETLAVAIALYPDEAQLVTAADDYPEMRTKLELLRTSPELQAHFLDRVRHRVAVCPDRKIIDTLEPAVDQVDNRLE